MSAALPRLFVQGEAVCPVPDRCGWVAPFDGTLLGFTKPYDKPWDISPLRAANEPAKPPLKED